MGAVEGKSDMVRYPDCQRADRDCSVCPLSSYNRDCHNNPISNLAFYRCSAGLSQSELAKKAGISVRVLQNYEQGTRDLKKAAAETVLSLARVLGKAVEDLM